MEPNQDVVVVVLDACSTVCLSTAVMTMQQSLRQIGGGSHGSQDSGDPATPQQCATICQIREARRINVQIPK